MRSLIRSSIILNIFCLLACRTIQAQGTVTYLSSLSSTSTGSSSVGSDSWLAAQFQTGNNAGGYLLNSVQLAMVGASGDPDGLTVMLYANSGVSGPLPGSNLGNLSGSASPTTAGTYTYTAPANLTLSPDTVYFIVATAGTTVANGAYNWNESAYPPSANPGWSDGNAVLRSIDGGAIWSPTTPYTGIAQFALNATAAPEPSVAWLALMGGGAFFGLRRWKKRV